MKNWATMVIAAAIASTAACGSSSTDPGDQLEGGVLATFRVSGEDFHVWVTDEEAISQILALRDGTSTANIPNGALRSGTGRAGHNVPWSWHLDPVDFAMAELAIEVCDGRPSLVESLRDDYFTVGRFCPWGAELVDLEDHR